MRNKKNVALGLLLVSCLGCMGGAGSKLDPPPSSGKILAPGRGSALVDEWYVDGVLRFSASSGQTWTGSQFGIHRYAKDTPGVDHVYFASFNNSTTNELRFSSATRATYQGEATQIVRSKIDGRVYRLAGRMTFTIEDRGIGTDRLRLTFEVEPSTNAQHAVTGELCNVQLKSCDVRFEFD